jgi:signal transduction histidine kinase
MPSLNFTVDSALLRELGERLVGKPHIALAELVKNSFDADATACVIRLLNNSIQVVDNGHGMSLSEFKAFWMRIGSPHKSAEGVSRNLKRPLTGSKGVGRLAVQFLARELQIHTVSEENEDSVLIGNVDWEKACNAGELTKATVDYENEKAAQSFPEDLGHGTRITLKGLNQEWDEKSIEALAKEIWWLQPPFRTNPRLKSDKQKSFTIEFETDDPSLAETFDTQMRAIVQLWKARITAKLDEKAVSTKGGKFARRLVLALEFADGTRERDEYVLTDCGIHSLEYEIRVFKWEGRQAHGIKVDEARNYFNSHGGVHIYDGGFHLPYYGPEVDWLGIEKDHSHRLSASKLLPQRLQVPEGMNFLPTQTRLLGVVHVDSAHERAMAVAERKAGELSFLLPQITRDRLVDNKGFRDLETLVRYGIDYYATREALRALKEREAEQAIEPASRKFQRVEDVLREYKTDIGQPIYAKLRENVQQAVEAAESEAETTLRKVALLGPLATAGISSLAYQHELKKQFASIEDIADRLDSVHTQDKELRRNLAGLKEELRSWVSRTKSLNALFAHLADPENINKRARFRAQAVIGEVKTQVAALARGIPIESSGVADDLLLPSASLAEWSSVFQNVFVNAFNALLEARKKRIAISSRTSGKNRELLVQDTGCGVDLRLAEKLFEPFERKLALSAERAALGYGGTGLGLTIVRLLASNIGVKVSFVPPDKGFNTAFCIAWRES